MGNKVVSISFDYDDCIIMLEALDMYIHDHDEIVKFLNKVDKVSVWEEYKIDLAKGVYWYIKNKWDNYDK